MNKVTSYQLIDGIKRNIKLILLPAILFFALILAYGIKNTTGVYEAKAVLMASSGEDEPVSYNKLILNEKLANIYIEILKSPDLYKKVEEGLKKSGSDISYKEIKDKLDTEVNPQAGLVSFSYKDTNEKRASDSLKSICENFRLMVKEFLNVDNLSYLTNVTVDKSSKLKTIIFSIIGGVFGALLGVVFVIIKTLLTNKIASYEDLESMEVDVLGKASNKSDLLRIKAQLEARMPRGVLAVTSLAKADSFNFSKDLAKALSKEADILFVDSKNEEKSFGEPIKKDGLSLYAIGSNKSGQILDSNDFEARVLNGVNFYNYIIMDEKSPKTADPYLAARLCDMVLVLVDDSTRKSDIKRFLQDLRSLNVKDCGVVYYL